MVPLPIANVLHHKLRSALGALGVAIGVCMLVTLSGLSRGSLDEVADRWEAVNADLIVYPAHWLDNITSIDGGGLGEADAAEVSRVTVGPDARPAVQRVIPVFLGRSSIGGQEHTVVGVVPSDLPSLLGRGKILSGGRCFDPDGTFATWLKAKLEAPGEGVLDIPAEELARRGGLEMVIDTRLADKAKLKVGSEAYAAGHHFTVVGIVPAGALVRAFIPRATACHLFDGRPERYTLLFVKLREGVPPGAVLNRIRATKRLNAITTGEYRGMLESRFGIMYVYVDAVNAVTLVVAFLFILVTLYTMVIQRTREIAILRSMGAARLYILREVLAESLILTFLGAAAGVGLSFAAAGIIQAAEPLLTVAITWGWIVTAAVVALVGGTAAAVYPGWCAIRVDVVEALNFE